MSRIALAIATVVLVFAAQVRGALPEPCCAGGGAHAAGVACADPAPGCDHCDPPAREPAGCCDDEPAEDPALRLCACDDAPAVAATAPAPRLDHADGSAIAALLPRNLPVPAIGVRAPQRARAPPGGALPRSGRDLLHLHRRLLI